MVKQSTFVICKSRLNLFLEPNKY